MNIDSSYRPKTIVAKLGRRWLRLQSEHLFYPSQLCDLPKNYHSRQRRSFNSPQTGTGVERNSSRNVFWDRDWGGAGQLGPVSSNKIPEVFSKVDSTQFPCRYKGLTLLAVTWSVLDGFHSLSFGRLECNLGTKLRRTSLTSLTYCRKAISPFVWRL